MYRLLSLMIAITMLTLVVACGSTNPPAAAVPAPTTAPPAAPKANPTTVPPTTAPSSPATAVTIAPTSPATAAPKSVAPTMAPTTAAPKAVAPTTAAPSAAAPKAAGGEIRLTLDPTASKGTFRVEEQFANQTVKVDAVGTTNKITGQLLMDATGKINREQSKFSIDMNSLATDQAQRDQFIKRMTLNVSQFPTAEFVPTEVKGLPSPLPTAGDVTFQLVGDMTVRGVTKPVTWDVTAKVEGQSLTGQAKTQVTFADFGMQAPRVPILASVSDTIRLELDFKLNPA